MLIKRNDQEIFKKYCIKYFFKKSFQGSPFKSIETEM